MQLHDLNRSQKRGRERFRRRLKPTCTSPDAGSIPAGSTIEFPDPGPERKQDVPTADRKTTDEAASRSVALEVITFDSSADIAMPFTAIGDVDQNPDPLVADGFTSMGAGIRLALRDLKARRKV